MSGDLVASLALELKDGISNGLRELQQLLEKLRAAISGIDIGAFGKIEQQVKEAAGATEIFTDEIWHMHDGVLEADLAVTRLTEQLAKTKGEIDQTAGAGSELTENLTRVQRITDAVSNSLRRMGEAGIAAAKSGFAQVKAAGMGVYGSLRHFGEAGSNLVNQGFGAAAEGFALYEPIKRYADYENVVRHIGITEGRSGADLEGRIGGLSEFFRRDALTSGQSSESIAVAYQDLVQMGIKQDLDQIITAHSRAATAYNTTAEALGPAVGAIIQTMKVPAGELALTMSAMAQASKEGRFKIEDFSRELPGVAAQMSLLGATGRKAADTTFAALEVVMRGSSQPSNAATNLTDLLQYVRSPFAARSFAKQGLNLHGILEDGLHRQRAGSGTVLDAVLDVVQKRTGGMDDAQRAEYIGKLFHNQQAGSALVTLLQNRGDYERLRRELDKVNAGIVERDFISAFNAPKIQLQIMGEQFEQVTERLGQGFLPVMKAVNFALFYTNSFLKWGQEHFPETTRWVLGITAGIFAFGAAMTLVGAIAPLIAAGFGIFANVLGALLLPIRLVAFGLRLMAVAALENPIVAIGVAIAAAAYLIWRNWDTLGPRFRALWAGVKAVFAEFMDWAGRWASNIGSSILAGISSRWSGLVDGVRGLLGRLRGEFDNSAIGRLLGLAQRAAAVTAANDNAAGGAASAAAAAAPVGRHDVYVRGEAGTTVTRVEGSGPSNVIASNSPNRGATVARP